MKGRSLRGFVYIVASLPTYINLLIILLLHNRIPYKEPWVLVFVFGLFGRMRGVCVFCDSPILGFDTGFLCVLSCSKQLLSTGKRIG